MFVWSLILRFVIFKENLLTLISSARNFWPVALGSIVLENIKSTNFNFDHNVQDTTTTDISGCTVFDRGYAHMFILALSWVVMPRVPCPVLVLLCSPLRHWLMYCLGATVCGLMCCVTMVAVASWSGTGSCVFVPVACLVVPNFCNLLK